MGWAAGPLTRTTAIAARPGAVETAAIVSVDPAFVTGSPSRTGSALAATGLSRAAGLGFPGLLGHRRLLLLETRCFALPRQV